MSLSEGVKGGAWASWLIYTQEAIKQVCMTAGRRPGAAQDSRGGVFLKYGGQARWCKMSVC